MELSPLRQRLIDALHLRHMSLRTEDCYVRAVARFSEFFGRSPARLGPAEIELYLLFLRDEKRVSWCWFNQTVCALRFFYQFVMQRPDVVTRIPYGKREKHLPVVLSQDELVRFLAAITNPRDRVILTLLYSAGLRLGEARNLRIRDIDSPRMLIHVVQGKGRKDRYAPLSPTLLVLLRGWYRATEPKDLFFPNAKDPSRPVNASTVQRAIKIAARRAGLTKSVSPHTLRHSFATHLVEQGLQTRVIQAMLGHAHSRTTEIYTHVTPALARSPLDRLSPPKTGD